MGVSSPHYTIDSCVLIPFPPRTSALRKPGDSLPLVLISYINFLIDHNPTFVWR